MTIAALRALLDQEQPHALRPPAPPLPPRRIHPRTKETTQVNAYTAVIVSMHHDGYSDQQIADHLGVDVPEITEAIDHHQATDGDEPETATPAALPTAGDDDQGLIAWGEQHQEAAVRRHAEQARTALTALGQRRRVDAELARIHDETSEIEQRLATLRAREAELKPRSKAKRQHAQRDYDPREVRAWGRQHGFHVPDKGVIPGDVLSAWRARHTTAPLRSVS